MYTDKDGVVWPDVYPDEKIIRRVLERIIKHGDVTINAMPPHERSVFLFVQTQHMQRYLIEKKRARTCLAAGLSSQQIIDVLGINPELMALIEDEPKVRPLYRDAGLSIKEIARQLGYLEKYVERIVSEIKNEEFAERQVKQRIEGY
jgi:hypothetical protein